MFFGKLTDDTRYMIHDTTDNPYTKVPREFYTVHTDLLKNKNFTNN